MPHPSKRKGNAGEREAVKILQEHGLAAERVPLSGAVKTDKFDHDISCPVQGVDRRIEVKRRRRAFKTIDTILGGNYAALVRDDNSRWLIIQALPDWAKLALAKSEVEV
jgi:hypothetical protein